MSILHMRIFLGVDSCNVTESFVGICVRYPYGSKNVMHA